MKLILSIFVLYYAQSVTSSFCYWNTGCPYKYFNSKTPYTFLRGDIRDSVVKLTDCEPISIWGLVRHGKRHPYPAIAKHMEDALSLRNYLADSFDKGHCSLCAQDVENLQNWALDKDMLNKPHQLTSEGYQELVGIGRRFKQAFSKLLVTLGNGEYTFRPAVGQWMKESAAGFVEGLGNKQFTVEPAKDGFDIMDPYLTCNKYQREIQQAAVHEQVSKYQASSEFLAARDRIIRRLGIEYPLTSENMTAIHNWCSYTSSGIDNKFSPWCALFTTEDLKVLEYLEDLVHYYESGYGSPMSHLFGQIPAADLLKTFQAAKEGSGKKITTYFTDKVMMDMVYTSLNLFKDENPLTGDKRVNDRKWRTSKISIFASNLFAVLNKCNKDGADDYNVVFYLNEEPLRPICQDGVCSWQEFEDKLKPFLTANTDFCN